MSVLDRLARVIWRDGKLDEHEDKCDMEHDEVDLPAQLARAVIASGVLPWRPIAELSEEDRRGDEAGFLLLAPELIDEDCNVHGVGMGYWQDDGLLHSMTQKECDERDPEKDYSCWLACKWSMTNDEWYEVPCTPTHYLRLKGIGT